MTIFNVTLAVVFISIVWYIIGITVISYFKSIKNEFIMLVMIGPVAVLAYVVFMLETVFLKVKNKIGRSK